VDTIRLINFIRTAAAAGQDPLPALLAAQPGPGEQQPWGDDRFLQPALADDELLFHDWEGDSEEGEGELQAAAGAEGARQQQQEQRQLRQENEALRGMLEAMRGVALADVGVRELLAEQQAAQGQPGSSASAAAAGPTSPSAAAAQPADAAAAVDEAARLIDASYFDSYSTFDIHREMLGDRARTQAYRDALELNPGLLRGATVLDVGCGTGILSMFAARGGASTVVGIDGSEQIAGFARSIVAANGLAAAGGGPITIVSSKVEELELAALPLPAAAAGVEQQQGAAATADGRQQQQQEQGQQDEKRVDVLVSEWMGYALLFESMLDSVLHARDRWLRPGGAVLPDLANLYVAAAGEGATGMDFWKDVYGFRWAVGWWAAAGL
jgi:protein arginine N-methyltransferase 3